MRNIPGGGQYLKEQENHKERNIAIILAVYIGLQLGGWSFWGPAVTSCGYSLPAGLSPSGVEAISGLFGIAAWIEAITVAMSKDYRWIGIMLIVLSLFGFLT
jgi:hypothetical protein